MTDEDYEQVQVFLRKVKKAFHELIGSTDDTLGATYLAQDALSLFSPWMNNPIEEGGEQDD